MTEVMLNFGLRMRLSIRIISVLISLSDDRQFVFNSWSIRVSSVLVVEQRDMDKQLDAKLRHLWSAL